MNSRPKYWTEDESIIVDSHTYEMKYVHKYIKRCVKGTSADVKTIKIRHGLLNAGYSGLSIFDEKTIYINAYEREYIKELYLAVFHEIFHFFFRDGDDQRNKPLDKDDFTDRRAEKSAKNMLKWYTENPKYFREIKLILNRLPIETISNEEKEDL